MLHAEGTQPLQTYIDISQATVVQWVSTQLIFEVCSEKETGYTGRGGATVTMVEADSSGRPTEVHDKSDFGGGNRPPNILLQGS